jgi:site-specific DNA recombinase
MRPRPESEWIETQAPDLRIVTEELWNAVQERRVGHEVYSQGGRRPKHLLSGLLVCAECGSHYTIQTGRPYEKYGCVAHADRGPDICSNAKLVRRDKAEEAIIRLISEELFSPETVAYLTDRVNRALTRKTMPPEDLRKQKQAKLAQARTELANVKKAILNGLDTPVTKEMLLECAEKVAALEADLRIPPSRPKAVDLSSAVTRHLTDLRATLGRDNERARGHYPNWSNGSFYGVTGTG